MTLLFVGSKTLETGLVYVQDDINYKAYSYNAGAQKSVCNWLEF